MPQGTADVIQAPPDEQSPPSPVLAARSDRFLAVLVDAAIVLVFSIPLQIYEGVFSTVFHNERVPTAVTVRDAIAIWAWFFVVNGYWLKRYGQTAGKRFLMIRICDYRTAAVPPFQRVLLRFVAPAVFGLLGLFGALFAWADILFIFRKDRRCIHDLIAGTRVVQAWPER